MCQQNGMDQKYSSCLLSCRLKLEDESKQQAGFQLGEVFSFYYSLFLLRIFIFPSTYMCLIYPLLSSCSLVDIAAEYKDNNITRARQMVKQKKTKSSSSLTHSFTRKYYFKNDKSIYMFILFIFLPQLILAPEFELKSALRIRPWNG